MSKIYIVFIKALTGLGKISRAFNDYEFTHVAVSFDKSLKDFVTFSRRKHNTPFDAGFMHETRDCYAFGKNEWVGIKVYEVPVTEENLSNIHEYVTEMEEKGYYFNLYSMVTMPVLHGFKIQKAENCMSFTAKVIELAGINLNRPYYKYNIEEIENLLKEFPNKKCRLYKRENDRPEYMQKAGIKANLIDFGKLNLDLIRRLY